MSSRLLLDSGPLGMVVHPRKNKEIAAWLRSQLERGAEIIIPEICDYEVRRSLLLKGFVQSVSRLDDLKTKLSYLPLSTGTMLRAAQLWADARRQGHPTADPKELDADVILAAQAEDARGIVVTENVGHLGLFVDAKAWRDLS